MPVGQNGHLALCGQIRHKRFNLRFPDPHGIVNGTLAGCFDPVGVQEGAILLPSLLLKLKKGANQLSTKMGFFLDRIRKSDVLAELVAAQAT